MRSFLIKSATVVTMLLSTQLSFGQFTMGVAPGFNLSGADFGYKINRYVPQLGFNYMTASGMYTWDRKEYDGSQIVDVSDTYTYRLGFLLPRVGLKVFVAEKEDLKMFVSAGFMKPFLFGTSESNGINDYAVEDELNRISLWGSDLSFGMEYFFSERFSFSGQFGLRYFSFKYDNKYNTSVYNPDTGESQDYQAREVFKLSMNPTFTRVGLNFYF
ncbi:MAG: hypothetical protein N4A41_06920 [Crocinitomicaceae bacterium]|nr:hypothetical protein [Crocinitomicaceae bacterium]